MKTRVTLILLAALISPLPSQTVLEWALSETSTNPDQDDTASLGGTLDVPIIGGTGGNADSSALVGRIAPVTLSAVDDSITISYEVIFMRDPASGLSGGGTNADFRWGLFNSQGTGFTGDEPDLSGWTGTYGFNSGSSANDADIYVRESGNTDRFYISGGAADITGDTDFANQDFVPTEVIYTVTITVTRLSGDVMNIESTITGDNGYSLSMSGQETVNAEFTFDRVGFWINVLSADRAALKASSLPDSTDGDSIPDLQEVRWFGDLITADDTTDTDDDGLSDLEEITDSMTDPTDASDPPTPLENLFVDFNADGSAGEIGPNLEPGYVGYTAPHESNLIDDPAGIDFPVFGGTVNLRVNYTDDSGFEAFPDTVKQMIGRTDAQVAGYEGTLPGLVRDWVGVDSRASVGANGPVGNQYASPTNLTFTLTGIPAGDYQYRAYHHDVAGIQGEFELTITDATRDEVSLGNFQMTASSPLSGNPIYDATGNKGTAGVAASTYIYAAGEAPPTGDETRILLAANIGQAEVSNGVLEVFIDDFPASVTGTSLDRSWLQGIGYRSTSGTEVTYVDSTLANTDIVGGGPDSLWADGDDASTGGSITDGSAAADGLWRFRSGLGNNGIWEATSGSAVAEDCVEIVTSASVPNDTYEVFIFYYPVNTNGDYPIRAGLSSGQSIGGTNPGPDTPPSALPSTVTIPFQSDGSPVVFTYRVYEQPDDESRSVVGVNGFEITEAGGDFRITSIVKVGSNITLTWISEPGQSYNILAGTDLQSFPLPAAENVASQGTSTTQAFTLPAALDAEAAVFFIVEDNP